MSTLTKVLPPVFRLDSNPGLCRLDAAGTTLTTTKCPPSACPYPTCSCKWSLCPSGAKFNVPAQTNDTKGPAPLYYPTDAVCCVTGGNSMREQMVTDEYLDCSVGRPCAVTPFGATDTSINYFSVPSMTSTIPPQISGMTSLTKLYECGSTVSVKLAAGRGASIHSCLTLFSFLHPSMFATLLFIHSFSAVGLPFLYRCSSNELTCAALNTSVHLFMHVCVHSFS